MYELNTKAAIEADQFNERIEETGAYKGVFTKAEEVTSKRGTVGIEFTFKANDGKTADYLTLWTKNAEGKELYGYKVLMALMTCLRVKVIKPSIQIIKKYDRELQNKIDTQVNLFTDLMNKPLCVLLQKEEYRGNDGSLKSKMTLVSASDNDGFTASEILSKEKTPIIFQKMVALTKDRILKEHFLSSSQPTNNGPLDEFDDHIPF